MKIVRVLLLLLLMSGAFDCGGKGPAVPTSVEIDWPVDAGTVAQDSGHSPKNR